MKSSTSVISPSRKEQYKAKIKAKVKLKVEKRLAKFNVQFEDLKTRLMNLKQDIESINTRMVPFQLHTKIKWVEEINNILLLVNSFPIGEQKKEE